MFLFFLLFLPLFLLAQQQKQIRRQTFDSKSEKSLPIVTIVTGKSTIGITTNLSGTSELRNSSSGKLVFYFIGTRCQTSDVGNTPYSEIANSLDEQQTGRNINYTLGRYTQHFANSGVSGALACSSTDEFLH